MAEKQRGFWKQGWLYFRDGTFEEMADAWRKKDAPEDVRQWEYDEHGFRTLKNDAFITHKIEGYIKLLKDEDEWHKFDTENMDKFFNDAIELFPYERASVQNDAKPADAKSKDAKPSFEPPGRFFRVQQKMIQRRFPWGRNLTFGDADLRDNVETLRYIFAKNFIALILRRRALALHYVLMAVGILLANAILAPLVIWLVGRFATNSLQINTGVAAVLAVVSWGIFHFTYGHTLELFGYLRDQYQAAIRASCLVLGRNLQVRQQDIIALIPLIFKQADDDKYRMLNEGRLKEWPDEARKWTKLAFWMAGRVEYNELSMQLHMWRIRRLYFGLRWVATGLTEALTAFSVFALTVSAGGFTVLLFLLRHVIADDHHTLAAIALGGIATAVACTFYSIWIVQASDSRHRVELDLIEKNIMTTTIQGHTDVNLHDIVAERLFIDKSALLYEEQKAKR